MHPVVKTAEVFYGECTNHMNKINWTGINWV